MPAAPNTRGGVTDEDGAGEGGRKWGRHAKHRRASGGSASVPRGPTGNSKKGMCPLNLFGASAVVEMSPSKHVKCPAGPSVKPHRPVKPDRPSGPSTGTHPQPNPLDEQLGVEQLGGDPLAPVIGGLLRDRVELCIEGEVQRSGRHSGAERDAAVNAVGLAQRALRQTRQSPAARWALRQNPSNARQNTAARGPILPPPGYGLSSIHGFLPRLLP